MKTKHTILSERELELLENLIARYGNIASFENFSAETKVFLSKQEAYNLVSKLIRNGWLIPIKKGIYAITDLTTHNFVSLSPLVVANVLNKNSYVSFEAALSYYNLFEQMIKTTTSVTTTRPRLCHFQNFDYRFVKVKKNLYFGFRIVTVEGHYANIAELEKTILDFLYFRSDSYTIDLLLEVLIKAKTKIDFNKLITYARKFPLATKRKLGFLLDLLGVNTHRLLSTISKKGYSRLTRNSKKFNAKWRLYYEDRFDHA